MKSKFVSRLASMILFSALFAGCTAATTAPEDEDEDTSEAEQALPSCYSQTVYYTDASMTTVAGWCRGPSICTGSTTHCTGQKTAYHETTVECC